MPQFGGHEPEKETLDKGTRFERLLAQFASISLLAEFVHTNPRCMESDGKSGRELCDVMIEDGERVVLLQLKTSSADAWVDSNRGHRWIVKKLRQAHRQALGAHRSLCNHGVISEHPIRGPVCQRVGDLKCDHMVVVITCNGLRCAVPDDLSSRGPKGTAIHFIDLNDFLGLCEVVRTLPDLLAYLDQRAKLATWGRPLLTKEADAYAYYLTHAGVFDSTTRTTDLDGEWDRLTLEHRREFEEMNRADDETKIYSRMIEEIRRCTPALSNYQAGQSGELELSQQQMNFLVARKLNGMRLVARRDFSRRMRDKATLADTSSTGFNFFAALDDTRESAILFLASREPRDKRKKCLETLMMCLSITQQLREVIGVATENRSTSGGRSVDFAIYEPAVTENHDPNDVELCRKLFKDIEPIRRNVFPSHDRRIIQP